MSTYEKIHGRSIQAVTTDPSETVAEGQVWYNTSSDTFKSVVGLEAWRSSAPYPRQADHTAGSGTQTAALSCSDNIPSPSAEITSTFEYNGSGWSAGGSMNTERGDGTNNMTGSQTASFYVGGRPNAGPPTPFGSTATEEYDGSSWTSGGAYPAGMRGTNAFGTLTAGVNAGGNSSSPSVSSNVNNEYNGTSWTSGNNNTLGRFNCSSSGTSTAGILVAGFSNPPPVINSVTEEYDGSSWTSGGSLPEARNGLGGSGTQTANIVFGGASPPGTKTTTTSKYDGTSWTTSPATLATGREKFGSAKGASQTSTLAWCGNTPTDVTEEYDSSANVFTAAAWSSGGSMNTARGGVNGTSGDKSAGATFGGQVPGGRSNATELYDGSSWTNGTNTPAARRTYLVTGTQTASLLCGGQPPTPTANGDAETFEFDGSSFTDTGNINNARDNAAGAGTQTAGLAVGGRTRPGTTFVPNNNVEEYDGSSWTTATALPAANASSTSATGPQTAAIFGLANPAYVASYDGTNWTTISATQAMPNSYTGTGVAGTDSSNAYLGGGEEPGGTRHGFTQKYDGTSWATQPSFATARNSFGYSGTSPAQLICGGQADPGFTANTEEFSVETTALNVKTLTQS